MMTYLRYIFVLAVAISVSACAKDRAIGLAPTVEVTSLEELPAPRGDVSYLIGPQEKLEIEVIGAESLSGKFLTDVDGKLRFPFVGVVNVDGKSPSEAEQLIADQLRGKYLLDPQVRVMPEDFPIPTISVGGQVKKPGSFPATGKPTLLRAINQAEGLSEYAKQDDVLIFRTVAGQRYVGLYNLGAIARGNYPDPQLFPNDIVMVGDSPERRRLNTLLQIVPPLLTTALILILQR